MGFVPVLHGLHRGSAPQGGLRQRGVVAVTIAHQSPLQVKGAVEVVGSQSVADAAGEARDHAVRRATVARTAA